MICSDQLSHFGPFIFDKNTKKSSMSFPMRPLYLCLLITSLLVTTTFGQCPPLSEGNLPQTEKIAQLIMPTKKVFNPATQVTAKSLIPVDMTRKARFIVDSPVLSTVRGLESGKRTNFFIGGDVGFNGPVSIQVPGTGTGSSKIVEQDGRYIIAGGSDTFDGQVVEQGIFLARFEADGTPDPSFGQGGSTRIILFAQNKMGNPIAPYLCLTPGGKIVVARTISDIVDNNTPGSRVAVVRLDHDGSLDPTFGNGGLVITTIDNQFRAGAVAVQRDERIIVAGISGNNGNCRDKPCTKFATLVRYQTNGQLDPSFGMHGVVQATLLVGGLPGVLSRESSFSSLYIQENGLINAAGSVESGTGDLVAASAMLIAEYLPTGELNPVFGNGGATMLTFDGPYQKFGASSLVVRENGRILAAGSANLHAGNPFESFLVDQAFVFAQLTPAGELDAGFGNAGKVVVNVNPRTGTSPLIPLDQLYKVMLDSAGDIYAAGMATGPVGSFETAIDFVALHSNGSLNRNFGKSGQYSLGTYSPWHTWLAQDALLTSNGRLVISGTHWKDHLPDALVLWSFNTKPGPAGCASPIRVPRKKIHP